MRDKQDADSVGNVQRITWFKEFGKIGDIRYGKALSDKHFPKCVFFSGSEYNVKNYLSSQIFEKLGYQLIPERVSEDSGLESWSQL